MTIELLALGIVGLIILAVWLIAWGITRED